MSKEGLAMVRCCEKQVGLKKGPWTPEEDHKLITYIQTHGHRSWRALPKQAGLSRCGKSCRLRWTNYLRPGIKRGNFSPQEENSIIHLHAILGNRWSTIATHLPGRTDNEIKNHWNTRLRKRLLKMGIDPTTHRPWPVPPPPPARTQLPAMNTLLLSLLHPQTAGLPSTTTADPSALLKSLLFQAVPPAMPDHVPPSAVPSPPPFPPINPTIDPALLAAAETRLVLDCLKVCSAHDSHSSSDHHLNQLITRLLLVKFLQHSSSNGVPNSFPSFDISKAPIHSHVGADPRMCSPLSADHLLFNQGLHSMLGAHILSHESTTAVPTAPVSAYMNGHNLTAPVNCNYGGSHMNACAGALPMTMSTVLSSSSYQQRLLQALPFLAESVQIEPCTSINAADDLSSNQALRHASQQLNSSPPSSASLPRQQSPQWPGADNHTTTPGVPLLSGMPTANLMAWEELLMRGPAPDRDIANASSSTVNNSSSSSSTLSSASAAAAPPTTPANHINNVQDYWSNLLNLISPPNINHHS